MSKVPHLCPVCIGKGIVPNGFYRVLTQCYTTSDITPETCKPCNGTGVIWSE